MSSFLVKQEIVIPKEQELVAFSNSLFNLFNDVVNASLPVSNSPPMGAVLAVKRAAS